MPMGDGGRATRRPAFCADDSIGLARRHFAVEAATAEELPSDRDQNFLLTTEAGERSVLKLANAAEDRCVLELQNDVLDALDAAETPCPRVLRAPTGDSIVRVDGPAGDAHLARLLSWVDGTPLAEHASRPAALLRRVGAFLGRVDRRLERFEHPAAAREFHWDLARAGSVIRKHSEEIGDAERRGIVAEHRALWDTHVEPALPALRRSVIHNDGNDHNLIVRDDGEIAIIDFGDIVSTATVCEPAIAGAYAMLDADDPVAALAELVGGYDAVLPLTDLEIELVYPLACLRLATSVTIAAFQRRREPGLEYLSVSEEPAWRTLAALRSVPLDGARAALREACGRPVRATRGTDSIREYRREHLGFNLSTSYGEPLEIVRGAGAYLYDAAGRAYLDMVNNVCHVGHCHPRVVRAGQRQMETLNTNTRYLHDGIVEYSERLLAHFPAPLSVVFFVSSGSEANELALRLARTHTEREDVVVVDGAYHGNTSRLVDLSPYKHDGKGGHGAPPWVHAVAMPDGYRGLHRGTGEETGLAYAKEVGRAPPVRDGTVAAFLCESLLGCGGQIEPPAGYLRESFRRVRQAGGVCIADEVQVGFGRVGSRFWGFELQDVVPDIVTLGKPMGNGHPLAAVVTTPEIAASFDNGMEYFATYGGNPVSCAIGTAVLDVIEDEDLQDNALRTGEHLMAAARDLAGDHPLLGEVRGRGLFVGIELVRDHETLEPAAEEATAIVERLKARGLLLSTDGPLHNVIKIKPPIVFRRAHADRFVAELERALRSLKPR